MTPIRLAVLISGSGRTLSNFIRLAAAGELPVEIALALASDPAAGGLAFAREADIPTAVVAPAEHDDLASFSAAIDAHVLAARPDLVCLAGFLHLWTIPEELAGKVMNIHPALIPAFSGKGYYGSRVHRAVLRRGAKVSGCTVHFADNEYDHGPIILQRAVPVEEDDTPDTLAARVFAEECIAYPEAIRLFAAGRLRPEGRRARVLPGDA